MGAGIDGLSFGELSINQRDLEIKTQPFSVFVDCAVNKLYEHLDPYDFAASDRRAEKYRRILEIDEIEPAQNIRVLDIGTGSSPIKAADFQQVDELVCSDLIPQRPDIQRENMLRLTFPNNSFDEVWSLMVFKYIDSTVPAIIRNRLGFVIPDGRNLTKENEIRNSVDQLTSFLGLVALGEQFRVVKPGGKVRMGSFLFDFNNSQAIKHLLAAIESGEVTGIKLDHRGITSSDDLMPETRRGNLIFSKDEAWSNDTYNGFLEKTWINIPAEIRKNVTKSSLYDVALAHA